eukprot:354773-Chlamydomonas_euryale.AAC.6
MHLRARHAGHRQDVATDADEAEEEVFEWPVGHLEDRGMWDRLLANLQDEWATLTVFIMSSLVIHIDTFLVNAAHHHLHGCIHMHAVPMSHACHALVACFPSVSHMHAATMSHARHACVACMLPGRCAEYTVYLCCCVTLSALLR